MLELEVAPFGAAPPLLVDECALRGVALPNGARYFDGDVAGAWLECSLAAWFGGAQAAFQFCREERVESALE
jgi:hypothetical protein